MSCRICLEDNGEFVSPCACKGSVAHVHLDCLRGWYKQTGKDHCEICKGKYNCDLGPIIDPNNVKVWNIPHIELWYGNNLHHNQNIVWYVVHKNPINLAYYHPNI